MQYHVITYGCQMNESDSERLDLFLKKNNLKPASEKQADLIIINMCSVRQTAVDRVFGKINNLQKQNKKIVLTGCILEKNKAFFEKKTDLVFKITDLKKLANFIKKREFLPEFFQIKPSYSNLIPIMTGCNNFCSYCVVPYTRGREQSRKPEQIIQEVKYLVKNNNKIIWLLGQNVNSYKYGFAELLERINNIPGKFWIQFTSSHPKDFSLDIIKAMKKCNIKYLNLPVQSGDDQILKKMNRPYNISQYKKIVKQIRKEIPDIALSTDIIVGFPGESKKQFENTKKLFQELKYDMAYINKYSPRSGTKAYQLEDNISWQEKKDREKELNKILAKTALVNNKKHINKFLEILVIEKNLGISKYNKKVKIKNSDLGEFKKVKIKQAFSWGLKKDS